MTDRQLIRLAIDTLNPDEFKVWITHRIAGHGRHTGSTMLGITASAYRYRLHQADRKMLAAIHQQETAA